MNSCSDACPAYYAAASELGRQLAERNITLVYGGATVGCMGAVAKAMTDREGIVRGFIPKKLALVRLLPRFREQFHVSLLL